MNKFFTLIFIFLLAAEVSGQSRFVTQKGGHSYTMDVPDYMLKTFDLNDAATLEYQNKAKEAYVIVIEDSKEELASLGIKYVSSKEFLEDFLKTYQEDAADRVVGAITESTSGGNAISQASFTWKSDDVETYMIVSAVSTKTHFYKVLGWTIAGNKSLLENDLRSMAKSLRD